MLYSRRIKERNKEEKVSKNARSIITWVERKERGKDNHSHEREVKRRGKGKRRSGEDRLVVLAKASLEPTLSLRVCIADVRRIGRFAQMATSGCGSRSWWSTNRPAHGAASCRIGGWEIFAQVDPSGPRSSRPGHGLTFQVGPRAESLESVVLCHRSLLHSLDLLLLLKLVNRAVHRAGISRVAPLVGVAARARRRRDILVGFVVAVLAGSSRSISIWTVILPVHCVLGIHARMASRSPATLIVGIVVLRGRTVAIVIDETIRSRIRSAAVVICALFAIAST